MSNFYGVKLQHYEKLAPGQGWVSFPNKITEPHDVRVSHATGDKKDTIDITLKSTNNDFENFERLITTNDLIEVYFLKNELWSNMNLQERDDAIAMTGALNKIKHSAETGSLEFSVELRGFMEILFDSKVPIGIVNQQSTREIVRQLVINDLTNTSIDREVKFHPDSARLRSPDVEGTSTSVSDGSLTDTNKNWETDQWKTNSETPSYYLVDSKDEIYQIEDNTSDTLNLKTPTPVDSTVDTANYKVLRDTLYEGYVGETGTGGTEQFTDTDANWDTDQFLTTPPSYLLDANSNIWKITGNTSDTIQLEDTEPAPGDYKIQQGFPTHRYSKSGKAIIQMLEELSANEFTRDGAYIEKVDRKRTFQNRLTGDARGSLTGWSGDTGQFSVVSGGLITGNDYKIRATPNASGTHQIEKVTGLSDVKGVQADVNFDSITSGQAEFVMTDGAGEDIFGITYDADTDELLYSNIATGKNDDGGALSKGDVIKTGVSGTRQVNFNIDWENDGIEIHLDDGDYLEVTGGLLFDTDQTGVSYGSGNLNKMRVGVQTGGTGANFEIDTIIFNDDVIRFLWKYKSEKVPPGNRFNQFRDNYNSFEAEKSKDDIINYVIFNLGEDARGQVFHRKVQDMSSINRNGMKSKYISETSYIAPMIVDAEKRANPSAFDDTQNYPDRNFPVDSEYPYTMFDYSGKFKTVEVANDEEYNNKIREAATLMGNKITNRVLELFSEARYKVSVTMPRLPTQKFGPGELFTIEDSTYGDSLKGKKLRIKNREDRIDETDIEAKEDADAALKRIFGGATVNDN